MAKKWTNENLSGALHFVTGNVLNRQPIFKQKENCILFLEELQALKIKRESKLIAFVIMPDHFHLIVNPHDGNIQQWTGTLKSLTARKLIENAPARFPNHQAWQESFKALPLWSNWMIWQKINYIHANPVKARLAESAKDYPWTSFRAFYFEEPDYLLRIDKDWWWPDDVRKLSIAKSKKQE